MISTSNSSSSSTSQTSTTVNSALLFNEETPPPETIQKEETKFDNLLIRVCSHKSVILIVFIIIYCCSLLYTYTSQGMIGTLFNIILIAIQMTLNRNNIKSTMMLDFSKADAFEKQRLVYSMIITTLRYFIFPKNKITFLPSTFMWFVGANKLFDENNNFWGMLPTYFLTLLYGGVGMMSCIVELVRNGCTEIFVDSVCESASLTCCIWVFTYYKINVTGYLRQKVSTLEETSKKLEYALESKTTFMAHISHEFRCPLLSSLGSLELLKETSMTPKQNGLVDMIISSNNVLLMLIEEVLQLMKFEFNSKSINQEEFLKTFNLGECIKSLQNVIAGYSNHFSVDLNFNYSSIENLVIESNPSILHQILSNLLTNAVKASKKNDTIDFSCKIKETILDKSIGNISKVEFKIKDSGCGIPESKIKEIFEPFIQLHNVNESHVPSSGLGLTTVMQFIKQLKGTIDVESELGKGSTFTVILPFKIMSKAEFSDWDNNGTKMNFSIQQRYLSLLSNVHEMNEDQLPSNPSQISHPKIILAEDNAINRKVLLKLIESIGFKADYVSDGQELLNNFNKQHHNLVITDLNMPNKDGIEASKELKRLYGNSVKIILLTGNSTVNIESLKGIVDGLLEKPCSKEDLRKCIELYCK